MEIGAKIRQARTEAGMTQEQAAEALGVSRQTVSNWETGKTYPDIVSVVRMSDLYGVSLDRLLKEDRDVSDYVNYLNESADRTRHRNRILLFGLLAAYVVVWALALVVYWCFAAPSDAMGYDVLVLVFLLPAVTLVFSAIIGANAAWGRGKWALSLAFGLMYALVRYATTDMAYMLHRGVMLAPRFEMFAIGAAISLLGMAAGTLIARLHRRARSRRRKEIADGQ